MSWYYRWPASALTAFPLELIIRVIFFLWEIGKDGLWGFDFFRNRGNLSSGGRQFIRLSCDTSITPAIIIRSALEALSRSLDTTGFRLYLSLGSQRKKSPRVWTKNNYAKVPIAIRFQISQPADSVLYLTAQGHLQLSSTFKHKVPPHENGISKRAGKKRKIVFKDLKQCVRKRERRLKHLGMFGGRS